MSDTPAPTADLRRRMEDDFAAAARDHQPAELPTGAVGRTMFDAPGSEDGTVTVLLARENAQLAPAQSLVRIESRPDRRRYLGVVSAGPFAQPDSLRPDSPVLLAVATRGGDYLPNYHGRVEVTLMGEQLPDGSLAPPRLRPLPHSPVFRLSEAESAEVLKADGDIRLGLAVGHEKLVVGVPSQAKSVLPRHTAILGTTGGGKSTTVAGLVTQAQAVGMAVVLLDVEGEYARLNEPTVDARMLAGLAERGLSPGGLPAGRMTLHHLAGRDPAHPGHPDLRPFSLQFARLSPYAVIEMAGLNEAQSDRFLFAYELAKTVMRDVGVFPEKDKPKEEQERQERMLTRLDEFERGYPRLTLSLFLDVVNYCRSKVTKGAFTPFNPAMKTDEAAASLRNRVDAKEMPGNAASWGKLHSLLWRLLRLKVFHGPGVRVGPLDYRRLIEPGRVSVIDLSDAGMTELSNLAVADVLCGVQEAQEAAYREFEAGRIGAAPRVLIVIEEAHEFLSAQRIEKMPVLFQQVARLAKRGRKRWLGLALVTQLPGHLPRQVMALCNSFVLHKLTDPAVVAELKKTVAGIDEGLWSRLPGLAPGQAVLSFPHLARPLLVSIDPSPAHLRLAD